MIIIFVIVIVIVIVVIVVVVSIIIADPSHCPTADKCIPTGKQFVQTVEVAMLYYVFNSVI